MIELPRDPSARFEPQFRDEPPAPGSVPPPEAPSESGASVWDEPALSPELTGTPPPGAATTAARLLAARERTPEAATWAVTAIVAACAGIWAILGAFLGMQSASSWLVLVVVVAPTAEEVLKVSLPLAVVELRPHLFSSRIQIGIAAASSGLVFAAVENLLYLGVYIAEPSEEIALWRWTVCVALHTGCSLISGLGVARVWAEVWERLAPPRPDLAARYIALAAAIHGAYNALAAFRVIGPKA